MPNITVERTHHLGQERALKTIEQVAQGLQQELGGTYFWDEGVMHFSRKGAQGRIVAEETTIRVELKVSPLLRPMHGRIRETVEQYLDRQLALAR